ncbi:MAG: transcriptional regulator NrdR [Acidimicrobiales bacterium]
MKCPWCASLDDKVVDSRLAEEGQVIRRRRECEACGRRYTTFERIEEVPLVVRKRSGMSEPFDRSKLVAGVRAASKNRPVTGPDIEGLVADVEEAVRLQGPEVDARRIGETVLERLRELDKVAYVRFASVYNRFDRPSDFEREVELLKTAGKGWPSTE